MKIIICHGRACFETITATASNGECFIGGMDVGFHWSWPLIRWEGAILGPAGDNFKDLEVSEH
jgi:hypothetical protein